MKKALIFAACLGLSTIAVAQKGTGGGVLMTDQAAGPPPPANPHIVNATVVSTQTTGGGTELAIDISGVENWDLLNDPDNTVLAVPLPPGAMMTGIGWDVTLTTIGSSWLSEARIYFDGSDQDLMGLFLTPGVGNSFPGTGVFFSSGGILDLTDNGIPDIPILGDGMLFIQFHETFDDVADAVDSFWENGSTLTITYTGGTAVPTVGEWGLIILTVFLFAGIVWFSVRSRKPAPAVV